MEINNRRINLGERPYIIAELSANHGGELRNAMLLLEKVAKSGADAFKIQTYSADSMTLDLDSSDFIISQGTWKSRKLYDIYSEGAMPQEWVSPLIKEANKLGITLFSTPFDTSAVDFLESLDICAYKIASFELTFDSLLERIGKTGKPVILSTGMASEEEIAHAIGILRASGSKSISLLKCTSSYPASHADLNLLAIPEMIMKFSLPIGFSDHTNGMTASLVAVALGACIIEKHIKDDADNSSLDSTFSLPISQLADFVNEINAASDSRGAKTIGPTSNELFYLKYRRSIIAKTNIKSGDIFSDSNITVVRPMIGLSPKYFKNIVGQASKRNINRGEGLTEQDLGITNE